MNRTATDSLLPAIGRRSFLAAAAAVVAAPAVLGQTKRDWSGKNPARYPDPDIVVLEKEFDGKQFNAPNDGAVHKDGGIWFTDPGYGSLMAYEGNKEKGDSPQPIQKEAVYRIDPKTLKVEKMFDDMFKPNGLCFSP